MRWQTQISVPRSLNEISYQDSLLAMGSCFAENMGDYFKKAGFSIRVNPEGILFNPLSIAESIEGIMNATLLEESECVFHEGLWYSFKHHGSFAQPTEEQLMRKAKEVMLQSREYLQQASWLILTFGTAFVYKKKSGMLVANCHKLPSSYFTKELCKLDELICTYENLINHLQTFNPKLKILFTVSPVRHWNDGYRQNLLSKSILHLLVEHLQFQFPSLHYFPAYEIVMDELRDYRYYAEDMLHIHPLSVQYLWETFMQSNFSKETIAIVSEVMQIRAMQGHIPIHLHTSDDHLQKIKERITNLKQKYPFIRLAES